MKILIKNGTIVNYDGIKQADILVDNDSIVQISKGIKEKTDKEIDAKGKHIFPGFIDLHTHLRTPGREDEEDFYTGSLAAAKGGFTTVFCMPNTNPAIDNESLAQWAYQEGQRWGLVDVVPVGAITKNREGKELTEFGGLKKAGCRSISDDGSSVADSLLLRRALEYAKMFDLVIVSHCEDKRLAQEGAIRESFISAKYGIPAIPDIAESIIVARDIELAKYLNARIHIAHVSTAKSVDLIRRAKNEGVAVTAETCPHYLILTVDDIEASQFSANMKVNPPLGTQHDRDAVRQGIKDGVIDCISTDHAPHSQAEKELPFENAPFGFIGLEFAFSLVHTFLVKKGILDLCGIAGKMSYAPAHIMKFKTQGKIQDGFLANLVIADLEKKQKVNSEDIVSKSKNTPFIGYEMQGVIEHTLYKGKISYSFARPGKPGK